MTTVLEDLRQRLIDAGVTPVAIGRRPNEPDEIVTLQTYVGPESRLPDGQNHPADERIAIQAMARGSKRASQRDAEILARRAHDALIGRHLTMNGVKYDWIEANHLPAYAGRDENDRALVSVNFTVRRRGFQ